MSRLRIAVVGAGHLGRIHTRLAKTIDEIQLVGVVDPSSEARDRIAAEFDTKCFSDHRELFGQVDAAIIAAPTRLHHRIASDLLAEYIHCFVEKPITCNTREADQLVEAARQRGLVLQTGHVERFNPTLNVVRDQLAAPRYIEAARTSTYTFRSTDVGVVLDLMIHDIDIVLSLVQRELVDVRALGTPVFGAHEDMAQARLEFSGGCVANLTASRASFVAKRELHVYSEDGYAGLDLANHSATVVKPSEEFTAGQIPFTGIADERVNWIKQHLFTDVLQKREVTVEGRNAILDEQADFVSSILTGKWPTVSGSDGRAALRVAEQVLQAIADHQSAADKRLTTVAHPHAHPAAQLAPPINQRRKAG